MRPAQMLAVAFAARLLRQEPAKPNTPSPPAKSGKAAGSGVAVGSVAKLKLISGVIFQSFALYKVMSRTALSVKSITYVVEPVRVVLEPQSTQSVLPLPLLVQGSFVPPYFASYVPVIGVGVTLSIVAATPLNVKFLKLTVMVPDAVKPFDSQPLHGATVMKFVSACVLTKENDELRSSVIVGLALVLLGVIGVYETVYWPSTVTEAADAAPTLVRNTMAAAARSFCIFIMTPLFQPFLSLAIFLRSDRTTLIYL